MNREGGFTLIEVLVAVLILSVALGGLVVVFLTGLKQASVTSNKSAAFYHANETLRMLASYVADDPDQTQVDGGFGLPESNWFTLAARRPGWQGCTDANLDGYADAGGDCYALYGGVAAVTHWRTLASLSANFSQAPISGKVKYEVVNDAPLTGWKKVTVYASWTEPQ